MKLQPIVVILILMMLFSCNRTSTHKAEISPDANVVISTGNSSSTNTQVVEKTDTATEIKFSDLVLTINDLVVWDEEKGLDKIQEKDTVTLEVDLGGTIEGQLISIKTNKLTEVKVEQCYETSVAISNEGPHCDLTDWKHYRSNWVQLQEGNKGQFIGKKYKNADMEKFPEIDIKELKEEVRKQCGEGWFYLVKTIKSPTEYPSAVGISRYYLRVTGKHKDNGQMIRKLIILDIPMGC